MSRAPVRAAAVSPGRIVRVVLSAVVVLSALSVARPAAAQDLEPRAFSPTPTGLNFVALGYGYSWGNVVLDPSLLIVDGEATLHSFVGAYVRTINFFGMSGKVLLHGRVQTFPLTPP